MTPSEDAQAAQRICDALRAGGIEVWLDQSELRGGDAWDRSIRQQIRECALFLPVTSAHTDARREGCFRLKWKLAVDRTHSMSERAPFLVPAVIDDTSDSRADVPDRFREVQWTRAFLDARHRRPSLTEYGGCSCTRTLGNRSVRAPPAGYRHERGAPGRPRPPADRTVLLAIAVVVLAAVGYFTLERLKGSTTEAPAASIAVLPLANESGETSEQYFSDGISEDLIARLRRNSTGR